MKRLVGIREVLCTIGSRVRSADEDTRFARRATREMGGLMDLEPRVALPESGNPGLSYSTPLVSSDGLREKRIVEIYEYPWLTPFQVQHAL